MTFVPGRHYETANVRNLLRSVGVELSEAMCLGIGGGIAAGFHYCPPEDLTSPNSGAFLIPRVKMYTTNGAWYRDSVARLGLAMDVRESGGKKAALANLMEGVGAGKLVVAWTTPAGVAEASEVSSCGMYSVLVQGVEGDVVRFSDHVSIREMGMTAFAEARERVCSFKNRTMTVSPGKVDVKAAVVAGLRETAADFVKPRLGTFNLPGLKTGVSMVNGKKNKLAWMMVYPGERVSLAMRDIHGAIALGTGGGFMRPLYAEFLDEAAKLLGRKELGRLAETYRKLGEAWTGFGEFMRPARVAGEYGAFLDDVAGRMGALYQAEVSASQELTEVVGKP